MGGIKRHQRRRRKYRALYAARGDIAAAATGMHSTREKSVWHARRHAKYSFQHASMPIARGKQHTGGTRAPARIVAFCCTRRRGDIGSEGISINRSKPYREKYRRSSAKNIRQAIREGAKNK